MQDTIEKLLKNFIPTLNGAQRAALSKFREDAEAIFEEVLGRSAKLYKKLQALRELLICQWTEYLKDRFAEGFMCGILTGLETFGGSGGLDGKGFLPLKQNVLNLHGKYYQSTEQKQAAEKSERFIKALTKEFKQETEVIRRVCDCWENISFTEEAAYWNKGLRTGMGIGVNLALYLDKFEN